MKFYFEIGQKKKKDKVVFDDAIQKRVVHKHFFLIKHIKTLSLICVFVCLYVLCGRVANVKGLLSSILRSPKAFVSLFTFFAPSLNSFKYSQEIATSYIRTLLIAISSTTFACTIALILAILSSDIVKKRGVFFHILAVFITIFTSIFRNIPLPAWVILFLFSFGQNEVTAFVVFFVLTLGYLTRIFRELINTSCKQSFFALQAFGASYTSAIIHGLLPSIEGQFVSWLLYTMSTNIRDSALVGILSGSGLGFLFTLFFRSFRYDAAGLVVVVIAITVLIFDFFASKAKGFIFNAKVKEKCINAKRIFSHSLLVVLLLISILSLFFIKGGDSTLAKTATALFNNIYAMFFNAKVSSLLAFKNLIFSAYVSLALAFMTTFISIIFAFPLAILNTKELVKFTLLSHVISILSSFVRSIPTIIWVMLFSVCLGVGPVATIIGISLHSTAYLFFAFSMSFNSIDKSAVSALKASGAPPFSIFKSAIFPSSVKSILSWSFFRFEINFMNAVALGSAAGAGGIGYELFIAGSMEFDISSVGTISYLLLFISLTLEKISNKIKKYC